MPIFAARWLSLPPLILMLLLGGWDAPAQAAPLRFFALGDIPYTDTQERVLESLFATAVSQKTPFLVHVGDIKGGGEPCTDDQLDRIAKVFRAQPVPVIYAPGDNEWTDCHRLRAGGQDPLERLGRLRQVFFATPEVLRLARLGRLDRLKGRRGADFPELYAFMREGVMFVVLHVVGSNNNYRKGQARAIAEFQQRDRANLDLLQAATVLAKQRRARAMVLFFHADPLFENAKPTKGFAPIRKALVRLLSEYPGPVLLVHGDTHRFRHDHPLLDPGTGQPLERFTRAEVPGSPLVGGLWISIDPENPEAPFGVESVYPAAMPFSLGLD